jgi:hypothetical protein
MEKCREPVCGSFLSPYSGSLTGVQNLLETSLAAYNQAGREVSFSKQQGGTKCPVHAW